MSINNGACQQMKSKHNELKSSRGKEKDKNSVLKNEINSLKIKQEEEKGKLKN